MKKFDTLLPRALFFGTIFTLSLSLSLSENVSAQELPFIPDSAYVRNEIIIWFQDGVLNPNYLGCEIFNIKGESPVQTELPLNTDFIRSEAVVNALAAIGVSEMRKMIPGINPCTDIMSLSRMGDTLWMPDFWNALVIRFDTDQDIPLIAYGLMSLFHDQILWAQPNFIYQQFSERNKDGTLSFNERPKRLQSLLNPPNDTLWNLQTTFRSDTAGRAFVDSAWTLTTGDSSVYIGILDKGIDCRHPDLGGSVAPNSRFKSGWNYTGNNDAFWTNSGFNQNVPVVHHGTAVAGLIGASTNNITGVAGVAGGDGSGGSGASLFGFKIYSNSDFAAAVWEATATPLDTFPAGVSMPRSGNLWNNSVLNLSGSFYYGQDTSGYRIIGDEITRAIVGFAYQNGRIFVSAMGNAGFEHKLEGADITFGGYPMDVDDHWVITVSANEQDALMNGGYDHGNNLDLLAPSHTHTVEVKKFGAGVDYDYRAFPGTSSSAPIISGVSGLILSLHKELLPFRGIDSLPMILAPEDVAWLMKHTAQWDPLKTRFTTEEGWGVVNAYHSLLHLKYPYRLRHHEASFDIENLIDPEKYDTLEIVLPGYKTAQVRQPLENGNDSYLVKRYYLKQWVDYPESYHKVLRAWGRGSAATGYNWPKKINKLPFRIPLYRVGYCELTEPDAFDNSGCQLETNIYLVRKIISMNPWRLSPDSIWIPHPPEKVKFTYSVLARAPVVTSNERMNALDDFHVADIFPTPTDVRATIGYDVSHEHSIDVTLHDIFGRKLQTVLDGKRHSPGKYSLELSTTDLAHGVYLLHFRASNERTVVRKLLVSRRGVVR